MSQEHVVERKTPSQIPPRRWKKNLKKKIVTHMYQLANKHTDTLN